jgi:hypothetical protein
MTLHLRHLVVLLLALACGSAFAGGTAVRCGRTYQDRPCADFGGRLVAPTKAQKALSSAQPVHPACRRRGAEAVPMIDARLKGVTEPTQLAATTSTSAKRLISEVYRVEGSAAEQRAAVESACMLERQRLANGAGPGKP